MSQRERWIVYPLLFLALGAALRDKLAKRSVTEHVICEKMTVVDDQGRPVALLEGGELQLARVKAEQVFANNLQPPAQASRNIGLGTFLKMLQQAGGGIRLLPRTEPDAPAADSPPVDSPPAGDQSNAGTSAAEEPDSESLPPAASQ